jgi:NAD+ kinase
MLSYKIIARDDEQSQLVKTKLEIKLSEGGYFEDQLNPNVIFFVGGDGTFLRSIQQHLSILDHTIFVGVHTGTLGFFCEYAKDQVELIVKEMKMIQKKSNRYPLLEIVIETQHQSFRYYAVNEIRVENPFHTLVTHVAIDKMPFQTFRGTGLIVSSTLGSSAYNKSLGGALIDVRIPTLQLTEMATIQNNVYRSLGSSLVLDEHRVLTFTGDFKQAIFGYDYMIADLKEEVKAVHVKISEKQFSLYHQKQHSYFETIKKTFVKNI